MADEKAQDVQQVVMIDAVTAAQKSYAEAAAKADRDQMDETIEGGAYLLASGVWVNAQGEPIKAPKGK